MLNALAAPKPARKPRAPKKETTAKTKAVAEKAATVATEKAASPRSRRLPSPQPQKALRRKPALRWRSLPQPKHQPKRCLKQRLTKKQKSNFYKNVKIQISPLSSLWRTAMLFAACLKGWRKMLCAIPFFFIPLNKWETPFDSIPAQGFNRRHLRRFPRGINAEEKNTDCAGKPN